MWHTGGSTARDAGFDAKLEALTALCDLASTTTGVDHPLCLDCVEQLKDELAAQVMMIFVCYDCYMPAPLTSHCHAAQTKGFIELLYALFATQGIAIGQISSW